MDNRFEVTGSDDIWCLHNFNGINNNRALLAYRLDKPGDFGSPVRVVRSRGQHDPGDGNYFCSHITGGASYLLQGSTCWFFNVSYTKKTERSLDSVFWDGETYESRNCHYESWPGKWYATHYRYVNPHPKSPYVLSFDRYTYGTGGPYNSMEEALHAMESDPVFTPDAWAWSRRQMVGGVLTTVEPQFEDRCIPDKVGLGLVAPNFDAHLSAAYLEAIQGLPQVTMNNIANVMDILSTMHDMLSPEGLTKVGKISEAWLGYRYSYSTTKSDIIDLVDYTERINNLLSAPFVSAHGQHHVGDITIKCAVKLACPQLLNVKTWAERHGLALSMYNIWDMIPYSFMVDWLLPIGDLLEEGQAYNNACKFSPSEVWFSLTQTFVNCFGFEQCDYYRWTQLPPKQVPATIIPELSTSKKTWLKRGADVVAMTTNL